MLGSSGRSHREDMGTKEGRGKGETQTQTSCSLEDREENIREGKIHVFISLISLKITFTIFYNTLKTRSVIQMVK